MKKTYISPKILELSVKLTLMQSGSIIVDGDNANIDIETSEEYDDVFGARGGSWDYDY